MPTWLKNIFLRVTPPPAQPELGALLDTRTPQEKADQDIHISQIVTAGALVTPVYQEMKPEDVRVFGLQNQTAKSDCVAESRRKIKRILFKVNKGLDLDFSSVAFYRKRSNFPAQGMGAADAIAIDRNFGMTLDALVPSDVITSEAAANALSPDKFNDDVAQVFRTSSDDVVFTPGDLDTPAGTIQKTRKGVMMWFYFTGPEWAREVPVILDKSLTSPYMAQALRHSVVGVEPALYQGKKGVWIDDSALFGNLARRFVTEEFYKARNFWASYPITFKFEIGTGPKPRFTGTIISAQQCLRYEGLFPANVDFVENLGPTTQKALRDFQARYTLPQTGQLDPGTRNKLQALYV